MAARPLALARRAHATAYLGLVGWLQASPELKRLGAQWRTWPGESEDDDPPVTDRVTIRLTPTLGPADPVACGGGGARIWSRPLDLAVEAAIPATSAASAVDLADAMWSRLFPTLVDGVTKPALVARLAEWGVMYLSDDQPPAIESAPGGATTIRGRLRLEMWVDG